jgi:fibrillarin-like pre-rRNA processing protein
VRIESVLGERNVVVEVKVHPRFPEIYCVTLEDGVRKLATKNLVVGNSVYGERLVRYQKSEYRLWDPYRSKFAAAIFKGLEKAPIHPGEKVLYLGAASGTTASHISDIVGEGGHLYCVEFASRSLRELISKVAIFRYNISPILADARLPESYSRLVGRVDVVYCDVAQPDQARILADNADAFLEDEGWIMLAIKAHSIDVTKEPSVVYEGEIAIMEARGFRIAEVVQLEPYDKAHVMVIAQKI